MKLPLAEYKRRDYPIKCSTCRAWMRFKPGPGYVQRAALPRASHCNECLLAAGKVERLRTFKAEWWEVWWVKTGCKPWFIRAYGQPLPSWIPDGVHVTRESALEEMRKRKNKYDKIIHVRRYARNKS